MKKIAFRLILVIPLSLLIIMSSIAQKSSFNGGIVAGLNFSQLEGKEITDYYGLNVGVIVIAKLSKQSELGMELLFSQNGEYIMPEFYPELQYGKVWLNHIEVPVHFDYLINKLQKDGLYNWKINLGLAYTRLISYSAEDINKNDVSDQIIYHDKVAYLILAGTTFNFSKHIGLNLKATLPIRFDGLNWTLSARMIYMFK
jgi:hypothetical protein